jgi:hypothetical protein
VGVKSAQEESPWSTETWYTLNAFGSETAAQEPPLHQEKWSVSPFGPGAFRVTAGGTGGFRVRAFDSRGALRGDASTTAGEAVVRLGAGAHGTFLIRLERNGRASTRLAALP